MRGYRRVGALNAHMPINIAPDAVVRFAPDKEGRHIRDGHVRGRDLHSQVGHYWLMFAVPASTRDDYIFVATALGESCFK